MTVRMSPRTIGPVKASLGADLIRLAEVSRINESIILGGRSPFSSSSSTKFKGATHLAFGAKDLEVVSDCTSSRLMYRENPKKPFEISPLALKKHHSLVFNPADQLYYLNDTDHHRI